MSNTTLSASLRSGFGGGHDKMLWSLARQISIVCGTYLTAILLVLGLLANGLIIAVMNRDTFRSLPIKVELTYSHLVLSGIFCLVFDNFILPMIISYFRLDFPSFHQFHWKRQHISKPKYKLEGYSRHNRHPSLN